MSPNVVFAIPCTHPAAKNGLFHCVPSYINTAHMAHGFDFVLLDTEKVIAHLQARNPGLLQHAEYKFSGETAEKWLKATSRVNPRDMGEWGYNRGVLSMNSGQASMIKLVQEINLPCFPIAISRGYGDLVLKDLRVFLGYRGADINDYLDAEAIRKQGIAAAQEVLNAAPRKPGEPIPLATYDPNWKTKWKSIQKQLAAENTKPYDEDRNCRSKELLEALLENFHAQFRTTADYAKWAEDKAREAAKWSNFPDFRISPFPADGSVEDTNRLLSLHCARLEMLQSIEIRQKPLDYPAKGQPFAAEMDSGISRTVDTVSVNWEFPIINEIGELSGQRTKKSPYSYVCEIGPDRVDICFLQFGGDGPSPINSVEELATQVYKERFGAANIAAGGKYVVPDHVNFYIYVPPTALQESFIRVPMEWQNNQLKFANPKWDHQPKIPYVLRKTAAAEGLAKDPDAPDSPRGRHADEISGPGI